MNKKIWLAGLCLLTAAFATFSSGCKKPSDPKVAPRTMNGALDLKSKFSFDEIISKLPQTVLYNLGDKVKFYTNEAETQVYEDGSKILRFPISEDRSRYIYAVKSSNPDDGLKVYLRHIISSSGSYETNTYTAVEDIIDVESWTIYRQEFTNNRLSKYYDEVVALTPGWEQCAIQNGDFMINDDGFIVENPNPPAIARRGPYDCPPNPHGGGSGWIRRALERVGDFFTYLVSGDGMVSDGTFYPPYTGGGGYNVPPGEGGGSGSGGGTGNPRMGDPRFNQPHTAPGFENGGDGGYIWLTNANALENEPVLVGGYRDANGFINNRKTALQVYVQSKPTGMIKCEDLAYFNLHIDAAQDVGSYQVPQSVLNRINSIINSNSPPYTQYNTYVQNINNGHGLVNMDYFPVRIMQLPKNASGQTMSPLEFLEYFRLHLSHPSITAGGSSTFEPYQDNGVNAGGANINETAKFTSPYENSLGAWVHIDINGNDGTVVESDYNINNSAQIYWFTFTTMRTPLDFTHPVAGNRRFGIQPHPNGGWQFYTLGVDRCYDNLTNILNSTFDLAFDGADNLWTAVQNNVINFVNQNQGQASLFTPQNYKVRVEWDGVIAPYLLGQITLQQLKQLLGCP